jgi:hypothetical protein
MSLDNRGFTAPLRQAEGLISGTVGKLGAALAGIGIGFGAFKGIEGFVGAIKDVAEGGLALQKLSGVTGQSVHDLVILQKAFRDVGGDAEGVQSALFMLQKSLGGVNAEGQPTKKIFEQLGLSIDALKGQSGIDQIEAVSLAINQLADQESKAAAASAIYSRFSAKEMLALAANPHAIREAAEAYSELATVQQKNSVAFAQLALSMEKLKGKLASTFVGITAQIAPQLNALLTSIRKSFDALDIGKKIGDMILTGFEAAKAGKLGELIGLGVAAGLEKVTPQIKQVLEGPLNQWSAGVQARMEAMLHPSFGVMSVLQPDRMKRMVENRQKEILAERAAQSPGEAPHEAQDAFNKLVDSLAPAVQKTRELSDAVTGLKEKEGEAAGGTGSGTFSLSDLAKQSAEGAKLTEGDRLAKIGGFIGGGANRMMDYARRTADNTQKLVDMAKNKGKSATDQTTAAYA